MYYYKRMSVAFVTLLFLISITACGEKNYPKETANQTETPVESDEPVHNTKQDITTEPVHNTEQDITDEPIIIEQLPIFVQAYYDGIYDESSDNYTQLADIKVDGYILYDDEYPELKEALEHNNRESIEATNDFKKEASEFYNDNKYITDMQMWNWQDSIISKRTDSQIVSFIREKYINKGGAHPGYLYRGYTYDSATGKQLTLADVVTDTDVLKKTVIEYLKNSEYFEGLYEGEWETIVEQSIDNTSPDVLAWSLSDYEVQLIFNEYAIGPYAMGSVFIDLPFDTYGSLVKEEYQTQNTMSVHKLSEYGNSDLTYRFDADGDGKNEILLVDVINGGNDDAYEQKISIGYGPGKKKAKKNSVSLETEIEMDSCYVMKSEGGKYYLCVETTGFNDYHMLYVYDLNVPSEGVKLVGTAPGAFYSYIPVSSAHVFLTDRFDVMGTYSGFRECYLDDSGSFVPYNEEYRVMVADNEVFGMDARKLTLKQDVNVPCYSDADNKDIDAYSVIPAGTELTPYRTDGRSYMTFRMQDGRYIDIEYDTVNDQDDYNSYRRIQGKKEKKILKGIMYAG